MRRILSIIILFFVSLSSFSQVVITGTVVDENGEGMEGTIIKVLNDKQILAYTRVDEQGKYNLTVNITVPSLTLSAEMMGYNPSKIVLKNISQEHNFILKPNAVALREVIVKAPDISQRGDTLTYNLGAYKGKADYTLKDAIKKLPGIEVQESGNIKYMGKDISNFYIEGLDLLGGKYNVATENIPADYVTAVQVLNNHNDLKIDKGNFSDDVAINVKLNNKAKFKPMGTTEIATGYGDGWLYRAAAAGMLFKSNFQSIVTAKIGNIDRFALDGATDHIFLLEDPLSLSEKVLGNLSVSSPPIATDRYASPMDRLFTINTIKKITQDATLKANASYAYAKSDYGYNLTRNYYNGAENIVIDQVLHPSSSVSTPSLSLEYKNNSDKAYLQNTFYGYANFLRADLPTLTDGSSLDQNERMDDYMISNKFNVSWKRKVSRWSFKSLLNLTSSPKGFVNMTNELNSILQTSKSYDFATKNTLMYSYLLDNHSFYVPLEANYSTEKVRTQLLNNAIEGGFNNNYMDKTQVVLAPFYEYSTPRIMVRPQLVFRSEYIYDKNRTMNSTFSKNYFSFLPNIDFDYKLTSHSTLHSSAGLYRNFGDILDFLTSPIQTEQTTKRIASGILSESKGFKASLRYDFKLPLQMWFLNMSLSYQHGKDNVLNAQNVSSEQVVTQFMPTPGKSDVVLTSFNLVKQIRAIKTKLAIGGAAMFRNQDVMQNNELIFLKSRAISIMPSISSQPFKFIEFNYDGNFSKFISKYLSTNMSYWSQEHNINLKVFPIKSLILSFTTNILRKDITKDVTKTMTLMDAGVSCRHKSIRLSLDLRNILDKKSYNYTVYSLVNTFSYDYALRGRELVFTIALTK